LRSLCVKLRSDKTLHTEIAKDGILIGTGAVRIPKFLLRSLRSSMQIGRQGPLLGIGGCLEMLGQKLLHCFIERKPIFLVMKTVAFILFDHVFHGHSVLFQCFDDLI
jgi:hypothetical protein